MSKGGGGGGPSESTVVQTNLPEYAEPFYRDLLARVGYESAIPYESYPGKRLEFFTPAEQEAMKRFEQLGVSGTPDELRAAGDIAANVGRGNPYASAMLEATRNAQFTTGYDAGSLGDSYLPGASDPTAGGGPALLTDRPGEFTAKTFTDPTAISDYMNPYQQLVVDREKEEAVRQSRKMGQDIGLQAAGSGSLGGYREAIMQAERQRNLEDQLGDIQARGSQQAFDRGRQAFSDDEARRMGAFQGNLSRFQAGIGALSDAERLGIQRFQVGEAARQRQEELARMRRELGARTAQSAYGQLLSGDQQRLAAAGMMGDFVGQRQQMEMDRLRAMQTAGEIRRNLLQRGLDIGYTDFLRQQAFPKEQLSFYSSMLQGVPISPGQISQSYGITPSTTQQLLGAGIASAGLYGALGGGFGRR